MLGPGCRSFPVGLYVPDATLDALAGSEYEEELDPRAIQRTLRESFAYAGGPLELSPWAYYRLDRQPALGPFSPEALADPGAAALQGLRAGDLVLVKNPRAQSLGITLTFAQFTFYDHLGVLVERAGRFFVCDSWPSFHPLGSAPDLPRASAAACARRR